MRISNYWAGHPLCSFLLLRLGILEAAARAGIGIDLKNEGIGVIYTRDELTGFEGSGRWPATFWRSCEWLDGCAGRGWTAGCVVIRSPVSFSGTRPFTSQ